MKLGLEEDLSGAEEVLTNDKTKQNRAESENRRSVAAAVYSSVAADFKKARILMIPSAEALLE